MSDFDVTAEERTPAKGLTYEDAVKVEVGDFLGKLDSDTIELKKYKVVSLESGSLSIKFYLKAVSDGQVEELVVTR